MRIIVIVCESLSDGLVGLFLPLFLWGAIVGIPFLGAYVILGATIIALTQMFLGRPLTILETNMLSHQATTVTIVFWIIATLIVFIWRRLK